MKILFLNPLGNLGGAERSLLDVIASLRAARDDFELGVIAGGDGPLEECARGLGAEASVLAMPSSLERLGDSCVPGISESDGAMGPLLARVSTALPAAARYVAALRRRIAAYRPDVIHTNGFKMHALGVWAAPRGVPVIWHVRDFTQSRPLMSKVMRAHASRAAAAITISRSVAADLRDLCGGGLDVHTVYNAIDLDCFSPDGPKADLDALCQMPPPARGTVRVGMLATMARWKGHELFLRAMSFLRPTLEVRAYLIGGPLYPTVGSQESIARLRELASDFGVASRVGFTGLVADPASAIRALDVVVHASTRPEPFGRVIAEAMACGRPVIASDAGGASEIISHGVDALAFPMGDVAILTRHIRDLVTDRARRVRLGTAGRIKACRRFDRRRLAAEVVPIYLRATGRHATIDDAHAHV